MTVSVELRAAFRAIGTTIGCGRVAIWSGESRFQTYLESRQSALGRLGDIGHDSPFRHLGKDVKVSVAVQLLQFVE